MSDKERVPVVVHHKKWNGEPQYQVFLGFYDRSNHIVKDISKEYKCFEMSEEVQAYIDGLETAKFIYAEKKK
jgi:hypothetical protein